MARRGSLGNAGVDHAADRVDLDAVAFVVDADEQVAVDEDFVFYNAPEHPTGAVIVSTGTPGEAMFALRPDDLPTTQRRVLLAAAIDGEGPSVTWDAIELVLRDVDGAPVAQGHS